MADILHVTHRPGWQDQVRRSEFALSAHGMPDVTSGEIVKPSLAELAARIEVDKPRVVLDHGFPFPAADLITLAGCSPNIAFVNIDHSSVNHTYTWPQYFDDYGLSLQASQRLRNFWVASPDRHACWKSLGYEKFFWWPNPVFVAQNRTPKTISPPSIIITGRVDWIKALPAQVIAAAILQSKRNVRCLISWTGSPATQAGLRDLAAAAGLNYQSLPYGTYDEWYRRLREQVSIVLQPSMSDSFNLVSAEGALHSRPWVGTSTIRHTPDDWRADPNDPSDIARVAGKILDDYQDCSRRAKEIGEQTAATQNRAYSTIIERLLNGRRL